MCFSEAVGGVDLSHHIPKDHKSARFILGFGEAAQSWICLPGSRQSKKQKDTDDVTGTVSVEFSSIVQRGLARSSSYVVI